MRSFFHALESRRVRCLLISGQASVLYGASAFSEDVDLWVDPSATNWSRALDALAACSACVYKLTPPLRPEYALRGHGFHFTIADDSLPGLVNYLDLMAVPPRVPPFAECWQRARIFETDWGGLHVVSLGDLVLLKRTQRLADYAVISALVLAECGDLETWDRWQWGLENTFDVDDLLSLWRRGRRAWRQALTTIRPALRLLPGRRLSRALRQELATALALEVDACRQQDREYWRPIVTELRGLQKRGRLIPVGTPVASARRLRT